MNECEHEYAVGVEEEGGRIEARCIHCGHIDPDNVLAQIMRSANGAAEEAAALKAQLAEAQAGNAAMRQALEAWERYVMHPKRHSSPSDAWRTAMRAHRAAIGASHDARERLALERATVQALRKRVADVAHVEPGAPCTCPQCERDRALLAQWDALGLEGTP